MNRVVEIISVIENTFSDSTLSVIHSWQVFYDCSSCCVIFHYVWTNVIFLKRVRFLSGFYDTAV